MQCQDLLTEINRNIFIFAKQKIFISLHYFEEKKNFMTSEISIMSNTHSKQLFSRRTLKSHDAGLSIRVYSTEIH
jgi:ribosomal protein S8